MKANYNSIEECLIKNILNENVLFVFSTDVVKNSWIDWVITSSNKTGVKSVSLERFVAWDNFKSSYITSSQEGLCAIPSILRKLFVRNLILQNSKTPFFKKIINPDFATNAVSFTDWICSILPSLEMWHSRYEKSNLVDDEENQDYLLLYKRYKEFLQKNRMFEPSWIVPEFKNEEIEIILIYPEILQDYADYIDVFEKCNNIFTLNLPSDYKNQHPKAYKFSNARQELRRVILQIRKLVEEKKCSWEEIAFSVPNLENYKPYLQREFEKYCIPYVIRAGEELTKNCAGQIFLEMNQCEKFNYSYDSIRTLLLDEFVPWKGKKQNLTEPDENNSDENNSEENICILKENLIREGQRLKCLCNLKNDDNNPIDIWEKALSGVKEDERELNFYRSIKKDIKAICNSESFQAIQRNWYIFKNKYLAENEFSMHANQILGRCLSELKEMIQIEKEYAEKNSIQIDNHFEFFINELSSKIYAKQNKDIGVNIFPYRLSACAKYKYQFVIDASQKNMEMNFKRLSFLNIEKRKALGCYEEDKSFNPSDAFLWLYNSNNVHDVVQISYSETSFDGFAIPHTFLDVVKNAKISKKEIFPLEDLDEEDFYLNEQKLFLDSPDSPEPNENQSIKITENQKKQFELWTESLPIEKRKAPSENLKNTVNEYLIKKRDLGWKKSATEQGIEDTDETSIILSQSDMKSFFPCQRKFLFSKIIKLEEDSFSVSLIEPFDIGNVNHKILELFFESCMKNKKNLPVTMFDKEENPYFVNEDEILNLLETFIGQAICSVIEGGKSAPLVNLMLNSQINKIKSKILNFLHFFCQQWNDIKGGFGGFSVVSAESWNAGTSDDGKIRYTGKLDCVLANSNGDTYIVDFKTGEPPSVKSCKISVDEETNKPVLFDFQIPMYIKIYNTGKSKLKQAQNASFCSISKEKHVVIVADPDIPFGKASCSLDDYSETLCVFDEYAHVFKYKVDLFDFNPKSKKEDFYNFVDETKDCRECGYKSICRTTYSIRQRKLEK